MTRPIAVLLAVVALATAACGSAGESDVLSGFERTPTPVVNVATLPNVADDGAPFDFVAPDPDGLLLVYFGYTNCPDVCPTTLFDLRVSIDGLDPAQQDRLETAMITIDPNRDTDEILEGYARSFLPEVAVLRTDVDADLRIVADAFGSDYGVSTNDEGEIEVIHTGSLYAVSGSGELLISWPFGVTSEDMAKDIEILLERASA